jgi:hypothetical protein
MLRSFLVLTCFVGFGCSKPASPPLPAASPTTKPAENGALVGASQRFRTALSSGKVDGLLAPKVLIENSNAERGCVEKSEPCVKNTVAAADAAHQLVQEIEGFTFAGPEASAKDLGCDATCCRYASFVHGDHSYAISKVCFDDSADPKVTTIVGD